MDLTANTIKKKINRAFWATEELANKVTNYVAFPLLVIFAIAFIAQLDYIQNRTKRDFSVLPQGLKIRLDDLAKEELKMRQQEERLRKSMIMGTREHNNQVRAELDTSTKARYKMMDEMNEIVAQAPHTSLAYNLYTAIGAIKPDIKGNIK